MKQLLQIKQQTIQELQSKLNEFESGKQNINIDANKKLIKELMEKKYILSKIIINY